MATPSKTQTGIVEVTIYIGTVKPDPFELSKGKNEQVQWLCGQKHDHNANPNGCFRAHFDHLSPFVKNEFRKHGELSGPVRGDAALGEYKYNVDIPGQPTLDPIGVVKP